MKQWRLLLTPQCQYCAMGFKFGFFGNFGIPGNIFAAAILIQGNRRYSCLITQIFTPGVDTYVERIRF